MALTKGLVLQGTADTTVDETDSIAFHNGTFDAPIQVGEYNDGTSVRASGGTDDSDGNTPNNNKYVDSTNVSINGGASEALSGMTTGEAALKFTLTESVSITVSSISMFGYDGTTETNAPTGTNLYLAEVGDTNWTQAHGSGSALSLSDSSTPATSHDFYVAISASPTSIGDKTANKIKLAFTYQ
jgi:hypothetical protein